MMMENEQMEASVRHLWTLCFEDTPEFVDLYFRMRYRNERNVALVSGGQVMSALQVIDYPMNSWGITFPMAYLSGVCTRPDARNQGWMRRLLADTHRRLFRGGYAVATLIPATPRLFQTYARAGYAPLFHYHCRVEQAPLPVGGDVAVVEYRDCPDGVYEYFRGQMYRRPCCVQHTEEDFRVVLADLYLSEGILLVARREGKVCGLAFVVPDGNICRMREYFADTPIVQSSLCWAACQRMHVERVEMFRPVANGEEGHPLGMLRVVCVGQLLRAYAAAHPHLSVCWNIVDATIAENNGCYVLSGGTCRKESSLPAGGGDVCPVGELPLRLWNGEHPYMSLMLD